ncbi:hypothetical protein ABZU45_24070 [Streptomyces avermitilis]|uniref:hypothetical protein n=1 Tax=Streptomyces avermitilis TaxID=33903 RepID=UPI0033BB1F04
MNSVTRRSTWALRAPPGCGTPLINAFGGLRRNAAFAYLDPARSRPNLTIVGEAHADRLNVRAGRVDGVDIDVDGERVTLSGPASAWRRG